MNVMLVEQILTSLRSDWAAGQGFNGLLHLRGSFGRPRFTVNEASSKTQLALFHLGAQKLAAVSIA